MKQFLLFIAICAAVAIISFGGMTGFAILLFILLVVDDFLQILERRKS